MSQPETKDHTLMCDPTIVVSRGGNAEKSEIFEIFQSYFFEFPQTSVVVSSPLLSLMTI